MAKVICSSIAGNVWTDQPPASQLIGEVHIYNITISTALHLLGQQDALLSATEQQRANRYYQQKDRERFIVSRVALRILLGRYLHLQPQDVVMAIGQNKKPYIANASLPVYYNVSHSGDKILIAVADSEVGVDIEYTESQLDVTEIIPTCFSKEDAAHIHSRKDFYTLWTRKEALLKATGKGIDDDIQSIPCLDGVYTTDGNDWKVISFKVERGYNGSVACANVDVLKFLNVAF